MPSSFFSEPEEHLDPALFDGDKMHPELRDDLKGKVVGALSSKYMGSEQWSRSWVAGSGASYRWSAARDPGDLDVLVGVDYVNFRQMNPQFAGLSDDEISSEMNEVFRAEMMPYTRQWKPGSTSDSPTFEVTAYVNTNGWDINRLNPYAAYSLDDEDWTVPPTRDSPDIPPEWHNKAAEAQSQVEQVVDRYAHHLEGLQGATNDAYRRNHESGMHSALEQASALYDNVHSGRKGAFGPGGGGYGDINNFLWQHGKEYGWLAPLKSLKKYRDDLSNARNIASYGVELPDHDTLVRRAATAYSNYTNLM